MTVEATVKYLGDLKCELTHGPSGQTITTDAPKDNGGEGVYFSPTDMVATATPACIVTIIGLIAKMKNLNVEGMSARVVKEMAEKPHRRINSLKISITLPAYLAQEDRVRLERAADICPVKESLHPDIDCQVEFIYQ